MTEQWSVPVWVAAGVPLVLLVLAAVLGVALARVRATDRRRVQQAKTDAEALHTLRSQVEQIERRLAERPVRGDAHEYVITELGDGDPTRRDDEAGPAPRVEGPLFADLVLRETVVQAASLAHGLRRALSPEVRHRVRFEMRRELKRARKQRRADLREARREWQARQRAEVDSPEPADADTADSAA